MAIEPPLGSRRIRVRYGGTCVRCRVGLPQGSDAWYDPATKTLRCLTCPERIATAEKSIARGTAGRSAQREHDRRAAKRRADAETRWGRLSRFALALGDEPQSTRAWATGATGERELAEQLSKEPGIVAIFDRRVPGTRGNIDALVVGPAGVFVVDAKRYGGSIEVRDVGPLFSKDLRLYVSGRDRSRLADEMLWQVDAVSATTRAAGHADVPITPVLCFIGSDWPLLFPPERFRGVRLETPRSVGRLARSERVLTPASIQAIVRSLAVALPEK